MWVGGVRVCVCVLACTIALKVFLKKGKMLLGEEMGVAGIYGNE